MKTYRSLSSAETKELGATLAREFRARQAGGKFHGKARGAAVFALKGDLGAGKTTFVQGFLAGLGLRKHSPSPTFIIMRRHAIRHPARKGVRSRRGAGQFSNVFHVDAYRLKDARALKALDFAAVLAEPKNIVLVEWADRARGILPRGTTWLIFRHGRKENERHIIIKR